LLNACKKHEENLGEVQQLIADGANINAVTGAGRTPLMSATAYGHINIVKFLLENGANINTKDTGKGATALMFSTQFVMLKSTFEMLHLFTFQMPIL
jgi:ankyrin repeat protein